jgi:stage II sporulation protein D
MRCPCLAAVLFFLLLADMAQAVENFTIRIGVGVGVSSGRLLGRGLTLRDAKGNKVGAADGVTVSSAGHQISVGGKKLSLPAAVHASSGLGWADTRYRGTLRIIGAPNGFTVVNELNLEDYLRGILKIEMNPEWPQEALKAQAILARTYAVKNRGRFGKLGFDLDNSENSQMYRGANAEDPRTDAAVSATRGQILAWGGKAADVYYHSDSGGATADIGHVWGGGASYLKPRAEAVTYTSPNSNWQVSFTAAQIEEIMRKMGKDVGGVTGVEISLADQYARVVQLRVRGAKGTADVRAHAFRMAAGSRVLRSTRFSVSGAQNGRAAASEPGAGAPVVESLAEIAAKVDPIIEMTNNDVFTSDELLDMLMEPSKRESYMKIGMERLSRTGGARAEPEKPAKAPVAPTVKAPPAFTFTGKGWGHGVGLSQWGAKAMAERGMKCGEILAHYFPGTKIAK